MKVLKKINSAKAQYQGITNFRCPECGHDFMQDNCKENVIGYDINIENGRYNLIFECPDCFIKSYCHYTKNGIDAIQNLWSQL